MATVSEACDALAAATNLPPEDVKKYARALINSGDLPKAIGRSVPQTDVYHRAKLLLALAASDRANGCVKAMRDRYVAVARFRETELTAGEVIAEELRALASKSFTAFQKWTYSKLEVSRGGMPRVQFRINENLMHFSNAKNTSQPEFLGGPWLHTSKKDLEEMAKEYERRGLPVSAYVSGTVMMAAAFGSVQAARNAEIEIIKAYQAHKTEQIAK